MTKQETLDFIDYLKRKDDVILESHVFYVRTFFNSYEHDTLPYAKHLLKVIKDAPGVVDAYRAVAHESGKRNSNWKAAPEISYMFYEDFVEYIEAIDGIGRCEKDRIMCLTNGGSSRKIIVKESVPDGVKKWLASYSPMIERKVFVEYFPTEYLNFLFEKRQLAEESYVVSVQDDGGSNVFYRKANILRELVDRENKFQSKTAVIGFNDETGDIAPEKCEKIGKFLCEQLGIEQICLKNYASDGVMVIKRKTIDNT